MSPLLSVRDLSIEFATDHSWRSAVEEISFDVNAGEILGIVGESGSGKTVTCRSLMQLLPPRLTRIGGQALFSNQDLLGLDESTLGKVRGEQIAMIFQNPSSHLDPLMRVGEQIGEALRVHRGCNYADARLHAIELLDRVGIAKPERNVDAYPHNFSGGMRQRVMIAAAIACQPKLLIADEPTTALDVTIQARVLELLKQLRLQDGLAIIFVSHDLGVIAEICDRVIVMYQGKIIESGITKTLLQQPRQAYTRKLIQSQPEMAEPGKLFPDIDDETYDSKNGELLESSVVNTSDADELLTIKDLHVEFQKPSSLINLLLRRPSPKTRAVDGISLKINRGDTLGIVGESGSGKSTLARAIVDLIQPDSGQILFEGNDVASFDGQQRQNLHRRVQMIYQDPLLALNPRMTVAETLSEALNAHQICQPEETAQWLERLLTMVGLPVSLAQRKSHQLSGGQCQRVGIARALSVSPEILIADESTSALDVTIQAQILNLLMRLRAQMQLTLIFISHDLSVIRHLCRTVAVMQLGRIVELGLVEQIFSDPQHPYTQQLIGSVPSLR